MGHGPAGYPEAAYGFDAWGYPYCRACQTAPFPLSLANIGDALHDYWVTAQYELSAPSPDSLPLDFIYDLWLERSPSAGAAPKPGDVELLIFLYEQNIATCARLAVGPPISFTSLVVFDGRPVSSTWRVCQIRGGTHGDAARLLPRVTHAIPRSRDVTLRIADFVQQAAGYLSADLSNHQLMGIELGGEFNQCEPKGCLASPANWQFRIAELSIASTSGVIPIVFEE